MKMPCADCAENSVALRTSSHASSRCGGFHRRAPTGGAAYGMPRKTWMPPRSSPSILPLRVSTIAPVISAPLVVRDERRSRDELHLDGHRQPVAEPERARATGGALHRLERDIARVGGELLPQRLRDLGRLDEYADV